MRVARRVLATASRYAAVPTAVARSARLAPRRAMSDAAKTAEKETAAAAETSKTAGSASSSGGGGGGGGGWLFGALLVGGAGYYAYSQGWLDEYLGSSGRFQAEDPNVVATEVAPKVKAAVEKILDDDDNLGPLLVRLAWHSSGTYSTTGVTGGSDGARMRFKPESTDGANAGLDKARALLEDIHKAHPQMTFADLYTYAGAVAIEYMAGPHIPFRFGRTDFLESDLVENKTVVLNGRLPDAAQGSNHLRDVFYRMGFTDQEIVALSGAHALGRCHTDRSGYDGPWTFAPTTFSNEYFVLLNKQLTEPGYWRERKWDGPKQYTDPTGELMMLPTDMSLIEDDKFKPFVQAYAKDGELFEKDFAAAFSKLLLLGVPTSKLSKEV